MNPRRLQITLLLRSRYDTPFAQPKTWSDVLSRQSRPGEGPSKRSLCEPCQGKGTLRRTISRQKVLVPCNVCDGRGWDVRDAYTERLIGTVETGIVTRYAVIRCDACGGEGAHGNGQRCTRCAGRGDIEIPVARLTAVRSSFASAPGLPSGDSIIDKMEQRESLGSYAELDLALDLLRSDWLFSYRVLQLVYAHALAEPEQLGEENAVAHDFGLSYLSGLMPAEIRVPSWAARNERRRREKLKRREVAA